MNFNVITIKHGGITRLSFFFFFFSLSFYKWKLNDIVTFKFPPQLEGDVNKNLYDKKNVNIHMYIDIYIYTFIQILIIIYMDVGICINIII